MIRRNSVLAAVLVVAIALGSCSSVERGEVASADGVMIHYDVQGSGEPALVFVHGWCGDRSYWRHQVERFAQDHRVVTVDLAGHGESGADRTEWSVEAFGSDVAAVADELGLERIILIGHSMGGAVNLEAALKLPGRVTGLVGVDTYQDVEAEYPPERRDQFLNAFKENFGPMAENFIRSMFVPGSDSALVERIVADMTAAPPEVAIATLTANLRYRPVGALSKLDLPIRCINSDRFPINVESGRRHAPSFDVVLMNGLGHFVMLEDPHRFNVLLANVIEGLAAAGGR